MGVRRSRRVVRRNGSIVNCDCRHRSDTEPVERWAPRDRRAISSASRTMSVRMFDATRQPTIIRENASTMKHTYAIPDQVGT